jgi:hypothetical protein
MGREMGERILIAQIITLTPTLSEGEGGPLADRVRIIHRE